MLASIRGCMRIAFGQGAIKTGVKVLPYASPSVRPPAFPPSGTLPGMSGHSTGRVRMAAPTCSRCGHAEWRYAGMLREAPGRQTVAWRCVACNWPRLMAPTDVRPVQCATCHEMNRAPRFADYFTCWNCGEDSPVA